MRVITSVIQVNSNSEKLCSEQAHRSRIPGTAWQLIRQPALALTRIIVRQQMCSARVPSSPKSLAKFHPYTGITFNVADVACLHPMLCDEPELVSDTPIAHWGAAWLSSLSSFRFEQCVSGQRQTHRKREFDGRVQKIFLKRVNDAVFHFEFFAHITLMSLFSRTGFGNPRFVTFSMARPTHSVVVT